MMRTKDKEKNTIILLALFWAAVLVGLFSQITHTGFKKLKISVVSAPIAPIENIITVPIHEKPDVSGNVLLLNLIIRNKEAKPKTIAVSFNAGKMGDLALPHAAAKEYFLEVRKEAFSGDEIRVHLRGRDDGWELGRLEISNVYGYATGFIRFVIIPRSAGALRGPPWFFLLGLFFLLFTLEALPIRHKRHPHRERLATLCFRSFFALFALFWLVPYVSRYRISFDLSSLLIFTLVLYFAGICGITNFLVCLKHFLGRDEIEKSTWKRRLVSFSVVSLIFLFFLLVQAYSLRTFKGNYSGFIHFNDRFLNNWNPLFWNQAPQLVFPNSDFEKGTLENWSVLGEAFRFQPTRVDNALAGGPQFPVNSQGRYLIGTSSEKIQSDDQTPSRSRWDKRPFRLVSKAFVLQKERIAFLIGKGKSYPGRKLTRRSVALSIDGKIVGEDVGPSSELMELHIWNVNRWMGREARLLISEHYYVDWFHYYQDDHVMQELLKQESGYDGQFYYYMTHDPFLSRLKNNPRRYRLIFDAPPYRCTRIGFSLLTRAFSLGRPKLYPKTMVWLILFSHLLGPFFLVSIIRFYKQPPFWAFLYILIPGFLLSLHHALPEPTAAALLLGGLYFYLKKRLFPSSFLLALSFLIRETGVVLWLCIVFYELFKRRNYRNALFVGLSVVPSVLWRCYITWRLFADYRWKTLLSSTTDLQLPFAGFIRLGREISAHRYPQDLTLAAIIYPILLTSILFFSFYYIKKRTDFLSLSFLAFSLVSISLGYKGVWIHVGNGIRVTYEAMLFLIIVFISQRELQNRIVNRLLVSLFILAFFFFYLLPCFIPFLRRGFVPF